MDGTVRDDYGASEPLEEFGDSACMSSTRAAALMLRLRCERDSIAASFRPLSVLKRMDICCT